jgi:hypothetical protein
MKWLTPKKHLGIAKAEHAQKLVAEYHGQIGEILRPSDAAQIATQG